MTASYTPTLNIPQPVNSGSLWLQTLSTWLTPRLSLVTRNDGSERSAVRLAESEGFGAWPADPCPYTETSLIAAFDRGRARRAKWDKVGW